MYEIFCLFEISPTGIKASLNDYFYSMTIDSQTVQALELCVLCKTSKIKGHKVILAGSGVTSKCSFVHICC